MNLSLRAKSMLWLMVHLLAVYVVIGFGLFLFNQYELKTHPDEIEEEKEELLIIYGIMLAALPVAVGSAWWITGRALNPLRSMLQVADQISAGRIEQRLDAPVATDELGHLARTLNAAFDNYQRLLGRVDRFSLDAAHQLRNPLAAMRTTAEVSLQRPRSAEESAETIARLLDETRRLGHTVDLLLLLARLTREMPQEAFEPLDLTALVRELAGNLQPLFESRGTALELMLPERPIRLRGSPRLLEQAVANLLDNALLMTPAGGRVRVEVERAGAGWLRLAVSDSGPGLADVIQPGVLSPDRPSTRSGHQEGTGLGLMIVTNVVHAHGGTVEASVSPWGGARFVLEMPGA